MKNIIFINIRCATSRKDKSIEGIILNCHWQQYAAYKAYEYARKILKKRWIRGESVIKKHPYASYLYARYVIGKRWKAAENIIAQDDRSSYLYARYILKGRYIKAEKRKWNSIEYIYLYSKYVLKKRWNKQERFMNTTSWMTPAYFCYIRDLIKGRFKKVEKLIVDSQYIEQYVNLLSEKDKEEFMFRITAESLVEKSKYLRNYAKEYINSLKQKPIGSIS